MSGMRAVEGDALIEPSFRRLITSIEAERERIRQTWQELEEERDVATEDLRRLRQDTEEWCQSERQKIDAEWKRLDALSEHMADLWPAVPEVVEINCSGHVFTLSKSALLSIEGSVLSQMFDPEFIDEIPRDEDGRFYLDFNPQCFAIVVEYLQNRRLRVDAPLPVIPAAQQHNMELLAEAWKLRPFLRENRINRVHNTSLHVSGNTMRSTHPGWQVISAQHPLPVAGPSYFEVRVLANPDPRGGLAVGVCGHIPQGPEIHSIRLLCSVLYNSNNGLVGDCFESEAVVRGLKLLEGELLGVKRDVAGHCLHWYHNRSYIGTSQLKREWTERLRTLYPVFGLYVPGQAIQADFAAPIPEDEG